MEQHHTCPLCRANQVYIPQVLFFEGRLVYGFEEALSSTESDEEVIHVVVSEGEEDDETDEFYHAWINELQTMDRQLVAQMEEHEEAIVRLRALRHRIDDMECALLRRMRTEGYH